MKECRVVQPSAVNPSAVRRLLDEQAHRLFQNAFQRFKNFAPVAPLHHPVVTGEGHFHHIARNDLVAFYDGFFHNGTDRQNTGIRWG